jgi:multicomponent Na+:H+ antiporter subunit G
LWEKSVTDELDGKYQPNSHRLSSGEEFEDEDEKRKKKIKERDLL